MKFALLGADAESLLLAEAAIAAGHSIDWRGDVALGDQGDQWEALLDRQAADGVIVGRGSVDSDLRGKQVAELVKLGRPVLATFPIVDSVLAFFEIDMARGESGAVVRHFNPLVESPTAEQVGAWVRGGHPELGAVEQIACVRRMANRSRSEVVRRFARDAELLDKGAGPLDRVGAHASGTDDAAYGALGVQLAGKTSPPIRWSVVPAPTGEGLHVTLVCERGSATVAFDAADRLADITPHGTGRLSDQFGASAAARAVAGFVEAADRAERGLEVDSTWPSALHAMELADSIEISLRRGRMIEIHSQQLTEELAFKGTMAAAGCGVLLVLIPAALVGGWIAGQFGVPIAPYWPHVLLGILALFLGLQVLPKLIYGESEKHQR